MYSIMKTVDVLYNWDVIQNHAFGIHFSIKGPMQCKCMLTCVDL